MVKQSGYTRYLHPIFNTIFPLNVYSELFIVTSIYVDFHLKKVTYHNRNKDGFPVIMLGIFLVIEMLAA